MHLKPVGSALEALALSLLPVLALGLFFFVTSDAFGTLPAVQEALATAPLWALGFLILVATLPIGLLTLLAASSTKGRSTADLESLTGSRKSGWPD
jgi:hypothetical protein